MTTPILRLRARLLERGYTLRALARELGRSHQAIQQVVSGATVSRPMRLAIARIAGEWPAHWGEKP